MNKNLNQRWLYLILGVFSMLFAGIIYAWSILKAPFATEMGWSNSQLALNFTITMSCFCIGGFGGAKLSSRIGVKWTTVGSGVLTAAGFILASFVNGSSVLMLYLSYGVLAGLGIGVAYNVIVSTVNAWFPDKKGLCSGSLMLGFGASTLVLGKLASGLMENMGWHRTYVLLGICLFVVLFITGLFLKRPGADMVFPAPKTKKAARSESFEIRDFTAAQMLRRPSFWLAFAWIGLLAAVGNSVISFAKDLALSVGAAASLATTLVGVLSICNGLGRIFTGALFDATGRRFTMMAANILTIAAAGVTMVAVYVNSLPLCVVGMCLVGLSYGACPTVASTFVSAFYGTKHFPTNFSMINFNLIGASLMATACGSLVTHTGGYFAPFAVLLGLSFAAMGLNLMLKKP